MKKIYQLLSAALFLSIGLMTMQRTAQAAGNHLDYGFSADGKTRFEFSQSSGEEAKSVVIQPDGKILVAGYTLSATPRDFAVARLNADGSLDTTFDTDGKATVDFGGADTLTAIALQADGKIVLVGESSPVSGGTVDFAVARLNANGSLDTSFDTDGKATVDFQNGADRAYAVAVQTDGKILVAGEVAVSGNFDFGAARLNTNGSLDTTFDTDGKTNTDLAGDYDSAVGIVVLPDNKIVIGGYGFVQNQANFALVRYTATGALDATFNAGGKVTTLFANGADAVATGFERMADGRFVLAGYFKEIGPPGIFSRQIALARYNADGTPDTTFDTDGKLTSDFNPHADEIANGIAVAAGGDIYVACRFDSAVSIWDFTVLHYLANGTLDKTFGAGGRVNTIFAPGSALANNVAIQTDGKIVAVGAANSSTDFAVARLRPTGISANSDFNGDGLADISVFRSSNDFWYILNNASGSFDAFQFGATGDIPVPGDFDGDGKTDAAVFRFATNEWWIRRSSNLSNSLVVKFGASGDYPYPGDYDGDGKTDFAVYRATEGKWYLLQSNAGFGVVPFGLETDQPVPADYDGDGLTDIAVFRPSDRNWWIRSSAFGTVQVTGFGLSFDEPVPTDYDGDARADIAVFRVPEGVWYINQPGGLNVRSVQWGTQEDVPSPADYDGDGRADIAVARIRASALTENNLTEAGDFGNWWILRSASGTYSVTKWGLAGDRSIPGEYFPNQ